MLSRHCLIGILLSAVLTTASPVVAEPEELGEFFTSTPVIDRGLLVIASSDAIGRQGHLRGYDLYDRDSGALWDAAQRMPRPGIGASPGTQPDSDPPAQPNPANLVRTIYTNLPGTEGLLPFTTQSMAVLQPALAPTDPATTTALINLVRGRIGCTAENPAGLDDAPALLWGLPRARPLLLGHNPVSAASRNRDRIAYIGAADGMLHAFYTGSWDDDSQSYPLDDPNAGRELWAYLPGSLLGSLHQQPFAATDRPSLLTVDGTPAGGEFYLDLNGDGRFRWHTLLAASATDLTQQRSSLFVLDVTDPYRPQLLWEQALSPTDAGLTRGVSIGLLGSDNRRRPTLFLSTAVTLTDTGEEHQAIVFQALDLQRGDLLWRSALPYPGAVRAAFAVPPPVPTLLDSNGDGLIDYLVGGDLAGRLWAINADEGSPFGDRPLFVTAGGLAEPLGAEATLHGRVIYVGSGGSEFADPYADYAVYAILLSTAGGQLLWRTPLAPGERVWQAPLVDRSGNLLLGVAIDYSGTLADMAAMTRGRLLAIRRDGRLAGQSDQPAGVVGQPLITNGQAMSVALNGAVSQYGTAQANETPAPQPGSVRIFSWRLY